MNRLLIGLAALLAMAGPAFSQGKKYGEFPSSGSVGGSDAFVILQGGATKEVTAAQIATYVLTAGQPGHFSTVTATGLVSTPASATGGAGINLAPGVAPTSPVNGDVWVTSAGMYVRANGVTVGPLGTGGTGCVTSGASIVYGDGAGGCTNVIIGSNLTFSGGTLSAAASGITQLTGAVTAGPGSGSQATTLAANAVGTSNISNSAVTLAKIANAAANKKLLGSGASGSGAAYVELTVGPTLAVNGNQVDLAGTVIAGTTQTVTATQWQAGTSLVVTTAAQTLTLPVSSTLSANGGLAIQTIGQSVTLAPNAADAINGGTTGASQVISAGLTAYVTTDGAGNIRVSPTSASGSGTVTSVICGTGLSGGTITSTGTCALDPAHANAWSGQQSFNSVLGMERDVSGTTDTLLITDCGKTIAYSNASAVTVTIPASIVPSAGITCNIIIRQDGAGQVAVTGTAVSAATLVTHVASSAATKTAGQHAVIGLQLTTISAAATAILTGDGA